MAFNLTMSYEAFFSIVGKIMVLRQPNLPQYVASLITFSFVYYVQRFVLAIYHGVKISRNRKSKVSDEPVESLIDDANVLDEYQEGEISVNVPRKKEDGVVIDLQTEIYNAHLLSGDDENENPVVSDGLPVYDSVVTQNALPGGNISITRSNKSTISSKIKGPASIQVIDENDDETDFTGVSRGPTQQRSDGTVMLNQYRKV
ncbi:hypothetical protein HDU76_004806 [Blyttiomyces sp. JEL0837]|nr:hypothetical protein HDU76_004806 [Blyttiomyces sp. JEL0837]